MGNISVDYDVLNQKGSPAWYSDLYANLPSPGYSGRMFISIDTFSFYRDNGTGWDLVGGPGTGTITGAGVSGQVTFFSGTDTISGNTSLVWDNVNKRLGINVATPTVDLDIAGSIKAAAVIKSGGTNLDILLADGTVTTTSTFQAAISLTSNGTSGAATLVGSTLNIPNYSFVSSVAAITLGTSGTDLTSSVVNSTTTPVITLNVPTASATNRGALSSADFTTFNNKQSTITLTTSGTSGAATLVGATLNVPNYTNVGTVTSVAALTLGTSGTDLSSSVANSTSTPVITLNVPTASATNRGALSSADFTTFNNKQATISVTAPVVLTGATISMPAATTGNNGYLTSTDWNTFNNKSNTNGTVTSVVALTIGTSGIDITSTAATTTTTPVITLNVPTASASNRGALSSTDFTTFNNKQSTISLTTIGTSGAATFSANTLNIPNYGSALSGYLPLTGGTLTGALSGTSASFSGNVSSLGIFSGRTSNGQAFGCGNGIDSDLGIFVQTGNILFSNTGSSTAFSFAIAGTTRFSIAGTGAATFSSSVTAGERFLNNFSGAGLACSAFANTSATGYGLYVQGGSSTLYALSVNNYLGANLFKVDGGGAATFSSSVNSLGINTAPTSTNASASFIEFRNTGGDFYVGQEGSAAGGFFTGSSSYASIFYSGTAQEFIINGSRKVQIAASGVVNVLSRGNFLNATDNALFSLNSGGTFYTVGLSPNASTISSTTYTMTTGATTFFYNGGAAATWTLPNPSGTNQIFFIKNASLFSITLNAFSGTSIINNASVGVLFITISAGATALIQQDGNVKSYQLY